MAYKVSEPLLFDQKDMELKLGENEALEEEEKDTLYHELFGEGPYVTEMRVVHS